MMLVNVLLRKEDLPQAARALTEAECLQVESPRVLRDADSLKRMDTTAVVSELAALKSRIESVAETLQLDCDYEGVFTVEELRVDPLAIKAAVESEYASVEGRVRAISSQVQADRHSLSRVEMTAWVVSALEERKVDPILVTSPTYIGARIGTLPSDAFVHTRETMGLAGHGVYYLGGLGTRTFVASVTSADRASDMDRGLKNARFEPIPVRKDLVGVEGFDAEAAELEMWEVRERLTENGLALIKIADEAERSVRKWLAEIDLNMRILQAMNEFLESNYTCLVTGWVPTRNFSYLSECLDERCEGPVELAALKDDEIKVEGPAALRPPTKLLNPRWLRPFELIIDLYGTPAYNGINPTIFVAISFLFIFGAMFGDVGHGAVLAVLGLVFRKLSAPRSKMSDLGFVLVGCGISGAIFGFLYGEGFGMEMHAYWRHPMKDPAGFLVYGVILGAVIVNLGLFINIAQSLWAGHYREAIFGEWGITTLIFYWAATFLFILVGIGRGDQVSWLLIGTLLGPPLLATAFGSQILDKITGRESHEDLTSAAFKPVEMMLASLTNTISFVRVPAFALNHVALMGAVLMLAGLIQGQGVVDKVLSWTDLAIGNIVVIALEGLIVFVQTMRLHYYEFFGKFFHHQGRRFEPLALNNGRREG
jgi:V/A-type H+-transporting ATPase subunit I